MNSSLVAEIGPQNTFFFLAIFALLIPITKILLNHQQRMAEIIHGTANQHASEELAELREEVSELKQLVHQQLIALDSATSRSVAKIEEPLRRRLEDS